MKNWRAKAFASGRKIRKDIFFNKKRREELRRSLLKAQKEILKTKDFSAKPILKEEYAERALDSSVLAFTVTSLETIKKAEELDKKTYLTKCRFYLFKKGKSVVFKANFLKPLLDSKPKNSYFHFPQGVPEKTKKRAFIFKDGEEIDLKGYKEQDFGTFRQKILDFEMLQLTYRGKQENYKFKLKLISEEKQSYWAEKLLAIKRS